MDGDTSIGPAPAPPDSGEGCATRATSEGVDAQNASEFDSRHGIAGIEAKPFSPNAPAPDGTRGLPDDDSKHEAAASQPDNDPARKDPNARPDLLAERRSAGPDAPRVTRKATPEEGTGRDDTLDDDLDRERLQPGQDTRGTSGAGADPNGYNRDANGNA